jgi:hypothetical protein
VPTGTSTGQTTIAAAGVLDASELVVVSSSTATAPDQSPPEEAVAAGDGDTTAHTITAIAVDGQQLAAGDVMFAIDGRPACSWWASTPPTATSTTVWTTAPMWPNWSRT